MDREYYKLAARLQETLQRAKELGMFVEDRELLRCGICGLIEDVTFKGLLVVYPDTDESQSDTGLRFEEIDGERYRCPWCGAALRVPSVEERSDV